MGNGECGIKGNKKDYGSKMKLERLGARNKVMQNSGILQPIRLRRTGQSSEANPVRNLWSRDFEPTISRVLDSTSGRGVAVLEISNRAKGSFVFMEPKEKAMPLNVTS
jgi:hypothetical protein